VEKAARERDLCPGVLMEAAHALQPADSPGRRVPVLGSHLEYAVLSLSGV
jgi:hypothetical protein